MAEVSRIRVDHCRFARHGRDARATFVVLLLVGVAGCANARRYRGLELSSENGPSIVTLPQVAQEGNNDCGYSCMSSVALYLKAEPQKLAAGEIPEKFRNTQMSAADLIAMARMLELAAFGYEGTVEDLESNVGKGRPVLTLLGHPPRMANYPEWAWWGELAALPFNVPHWVVVVGFTGTGDVVLHDPNQGLVSMNRAEFVAQWKKRSNVAVLVMAKTAAAQGRTDSAAAK